MATSFYELSVPTFLQTVKAIGGCLDRAHHHCAERGADPNDFVRVRLFDDMAPFHFQIEAAWHHAVYGLEGAGSDVPDALIELFGEVTLDGRDSLTSCVAAQLDGHTCLR